MQQSNFVQQAENLIKAGEKQQAHLLLKQAVRQDPENSHTWLLLAGTSPSPQASLAYVQRAELVNPDEPLLEKARTWAERRVKASQNGEKTAAALPQSSNKPELARKKWQTIALWIGVAASVVVVIIVITLLIISLLDLGQPEVQMASVAEVGADNVILATDIRPEEAGFQESLAQTPTPETHSNPVLAKSISQNGAGPRATWTPTPIPTNTPTPSPTPVATFVSSTWQRPTGRPFGVGTNERWVDVDLSQQVLRAYEGNELFFETYISSGLPSYPTVTGQFRIWLKYEAQTMDGRRLGYDYYLENVPYVMYFYQDYALHGTFWHNNFGYPMSHGCVNMRTSDAQQVFSWAKVGTVVSVHQ